MEMITQQQQQQGQELLQELVTKSWESDEFKANLIADPKSIIEGIAGDQVALAEGVKIVVEDQTDPNTIYVNIPRKPDLDHIELTDEQLEVVAGGEVAATTGIALAVVGLFAAGIAIGQAAK